MLFETQVHLQGTWPPVNVQVVSHEEICSPHYDSSGRCTRAVVDVLGTLFVKKLSFAAFVAPAIGLVISTPLVRRLYIRGKTLVTGSSDDHVSLNREIATTAQ